MEATSRAADVDLSSALASAAAGDEAAFARIVARYQEELFSIAVLVTRDRSLAEDAVQSAWAIAWRKLDTIRSPERLRPWLVSVTVNECKQQLRKRRKHADLEFIADLALKHIVSMGEFRLSDLSERIGLPTAILDEAIELMRRENLVEVRGASQFVKSSFNFIVTDTGK